MGQIECSLVIGNADDGQHFQNCLFEVARDGAFTKPASNGALIGKQLLRNNPIAEAAILIAEALVRQ